MHNPKQLYTDMSVVFFNFKIKGHSVLGDGFRLTKFEIQLGDNACPICLTHGNILAQLVNGR